LLSMIIRAHRVVLPDRVTPASVYVEGGLISRIGNYEDTQGSNVVEVPDSSVLMPGLADTHVHVNEPGRTHWEGFATATRAAAAGGVTTIIDMPLNSIPATTTTDAFREKLSAADGQCFVDTGFWGGVVPGNTGALQSLMECGVRGFKSFLVPSG